MFESKPKRFRKSGAISKLVPGGSSGTVSYSLDWVDSRSGEDCPGYRSKIANGLDATTNFSGSETSVDFKSEPFVARIPRYDIGSNQVVAVTVPYAYDAGPILGGIPIPDSSADNIALGKYIANARKAISPAQGMTILGELRETLHMIRHPASSLRQLISQYNSSIQKHASSARTKRAAMKTIAGTYLESVFGWLPLLGDIESATDAYNKLLDKRTHIRVRGFGEYESQISATSGTENVWVSYMLSTWHQVESMKTTVEYSGMVKLAPSGPQAALDRFGFKVEEFVPTVWELAPWSFLVDYFTNIGEIVGAATFVNSDLAWTSKTVRVESKIRRYGNADFAQAKQSYDMLQSLSGNYEWTTVRKTVDRVKDVQPGVPGLEFSLPGLKQSLNIAALLASSRELSKFISKL